MQNISILVSIPFILTTFITVWLFYKASNNHKPALYFIMVWIIIQGVLGIYKFYLKTDVLPPRFIFLLGPGILLIVLLFTLKKGKVFIDRLDIKKLTLLHSVRVPVEIILFYIFLNGAIPVYMTFEGYNYDIIAGISAPIIYYLVFILKKGNPTILLFWNFLCLALLINIIIIAILSTPTPFQKLAFDQPNIGIFIFPFVWLPSIVVPIVLFSHLVCIRQILLLKTKNKPLVPKN